MTVQEQRYRAAIQSVLREINDAFLASSEPAPHPVWWKRLLRRPYRRVDHIAYLEALRQIKR